MSLIQFTIVAMLRRRRAQFDHGVGLVSYSRRTGNSGWVDVTWSLGVGGVAIHRRGVAAWTGLAALAADNRGGARRILVPAAGYSHCRDAAVPRQMIHAIAI